MIDMVFYYFWRFIVLISCIELWHPFTELYKLYYLLGPGVDNKCLIIGSGRTSLENFLAILFLELDTKY